MIFSNMLEIACWIGVRVISRWEGEGDSDEGRAGRDTQMGVISRWEGEGDSDEGRAGGGTQMRGGQVGALR